MPRTLDPSWSPEYAAQMAAEEAEYEANRNRRAILDQIDALEKSITPRRVREAIRGAGKAWLDSIDDQIAALRANL